VQLFVQLPLTSDALATTWQPPAPQLNVHIEAGPHVMSHGAASQWNVHGPSSHIIGHRPETHVRVQPSGFVHVHEPPLHVPLTSASLPIDEVVASKPMRPHAASRTSTTTRTDPSYARFSDLQRG